MMTYGIYIHIPFCHHLCHYCDFAKTANFSETLVEQYFARIHAHLAIWTREIEDMGKASSLYFGGGTPSLFGKEICKLIDRLAIHLDANAEITLEANPDDVTKGRLTSWRRAGINRLSLGVQSLRASGLRFLTRKHSVAAARGAIDDVQERFENHNVDLIYGWPGQSLDNWRDELEEIVLRRIPHLSLYSLTYEPGTPIGRRYRRGALRGPSDDYLSELYGLARSILLPNYQHEEVSNWCQTGFAARHNRLYWQDKSYLGIGSGAHGYLAEPDGIGLRYCYNAFERRFVRDTTHARCGLELVRDSASITIDSARDTEAWILETVACGMRTDAGVDLDRIQAVCGVDFGQQQHSSVVREALNSRVLCLTSDNRLRLTPEEWYRENLWTLAVCQSFACNYPRTHAGCFAEPTSSLS